MKKIVVLGGTGIVGSVVVKDLFETCKDCDILLASSSNKAFEYASSFRSSRVRGVVVDVTDIPATAKIIKGSDVVINCVNYYFNLHVMKACLKANANYLDLGGLFHMTKKQLKLNNQFKRKRLLAVLGCGSTPGITNVLAAYGASEFDKVEEMHVSFGDADFRKHGQSFVLPYSFATLIDELTMKPALLAKGVLKMVEPRSGDRVIGFPKPIGKLRGFYALHSELATFPSSFKLKECSFRATFSKEFISGVLDYMKKGVNAKEMEKYLPKEGTKVDDVEIVQVNIKGIKNNKKKQLILDALAKSHKGWNIPAGTYDTAVPASIIAQMIAGKRVSKNGVLPPELCIDHALFFKELKKRNILVSKS